MVGCECGCRNTGLSPKRLADKGLFGLLVRSTSDQFYHELRHIHPNECLALQGFDPVIDFGSNPRLTLAAAGQMASPMQALWVFAALAERLTLLKSGCVHFSPMACLQAYQAWVLMRCRQVWPSHVGTVLDSNVQSLMSFWATHGSFSIHELMHPPRWPNLAEGELTIASVLDGIIRNHQGNPRQLIEVTSDTATVFGYCHCLRH